MPGLEIDMLIAEFFDLILEVGDVSFQRFRCPSNVWQSSHVSRSFDRLYDIGLISLSEVVLLSALNVSIFCHELPQKLNISPMNIIFFKFSQINLLFVVPINRFVDKSQILMRFELVFCFL